MYNINQIQRTYTELKHKNIHITREGREVNKHSHACFYFLPALH